MYYFSSVKRCIDENVRAGMCMCCFSGLMLVRLKHKPLRAKRVQKGFLPNPWRFITRSVHIIQLSVYEPQWPVVTFGPSWCGAWHHELRTSALHSTLDSPQRHFSALALKKYEATQRKSVISTSSKTSFKPVSFDVFPLNVFLCVFWISFICTDFSITFFLHKHTYTSYKIAVDFTAQIRQIITAICVSRINSALVWQVSRQKMWQKYMRKLFQHSILQMFSA